VKLDAVRLAFEKLGKTDLFIISVDEPEMRGITHQPLSREETLQGAKNRVEYCLEMHPEVDMAFGIE
jgi:inosine/xanthosine triphosphatase